MSIADCVTAVDRAIDSALAGRRIVGCVVLVAEDGRLAHARAAGLADREAGQPMQQSTWLRYASISKPFTTVAALRLMQEGRLAPDDPVTRWLPGFTPAMPDGRQPLITVDHLMSHLAGLDYGFNQPKDGPYAQAGVSDGISDSGISMAENLRRITSVPLDRLPGTRWRYSIATDVLGAVIEAAADMPLPDAMARLVTEPLGVEATFHAPEAVELAANYAAARPEPVRMQGLTRIPNPLQPEHSYSYLPERIRDPQAYPSGGGGMAGTAEAALTLLETLRTGSFLGQDLRTEAHRNRIHQRHPLRGPGWGHAWAGAVITDAAAAGIGLPQGCLSWGGIYGHNWIIDPLNRRCVIAMTNTALEGMNGAFAVEIAAAAAL
ncbi:MULTISPECIES: serine hydrolase domain-containing protein [Paracoccus]|uniref:Beta-lactamase/esterase n=1 Tax=Paracoccus kondratievae TaxID=135740 RepID=A0AAD3P305_9RHOB|nr:MULTISPECIES: serine hydrolase domain-containing protein [Paracoccus]GLK66338.1 beta-lactamase/esterase [Paracoccus kondratievae]